MGRLCIFMWSIWFLMKWYDVRVSFWVKLGHMELLSALLLSCSVFWKLRRGVSSEKFILNIICSLHTHRVQTHVLSSSYLLSRIWMFFVENAKRLQLASDLSMARTKICNLQTSMRIVGKNRKVAVQQIERRNELLVITFPKNTLVFLIKTLQSDKRQKIFSPRFENLFSWKKFLRNLDTNPYTKLATLWTRCWFYRKNLSAASSSKCFFL